MKFGAVLLAAGITLGALAGCMGPAGNPNGISYANEPGGVLAVPPQAMGTVRYDPNATPRPFDDMQASQIAVNPPPVTPSR